MEETKVWTEFLVEIKDAFGDLTHSFPVCGLCGNTGMVSGSCKSPRGIHVYMEPRPCICPNGRTIKKLIKEEKEKTMEKET